MTNRLHAVSLLHIVFVAVLSGCDAEEEVKTAAPKESPIADYTPTEPFTLDTPRQKRRALSDAFKVISKPPTPSARDMQVPGVFTVDMRGPESIEEVESVCREACRIMAFDLGDDTVVPQRDHFRGRFFSPLESQDWALAFQSRELIELFAELRLREGEVDLRENDISRPRDWAWKQGFVANKAEIFFVSPQGEVIRLQIYETPTQKHARIAWLMPYVEEMDGSKQPKRLMPVYRIQEGPGDVCLMPIGWRKVAAEGSETGRQRYWDDTRIIFFRENLYVHLHYAWPAKRKQDRTPLALRNDRNNPMDFARRVDAELVRLFAEAERKTRTKDGAELFFDVHE